MIPALAIFAALKFELKRQKYFSKRAEIETWNWLQSLSRGQSFKHFIPVVYSHNKIISLYAVVSLLL